MPKPSLVSIAVGVVVCLAAGIPTAALAQPARPAAGTRSVSARALLAQLDVRRESHAATYRGSRFGGWLDADHDGEDTVSEVLRAESRSELRTGPGGSLRGRWVSSYDGVAVTSSARLVIDRLVPLREAWVSGAAAWSADRRAAFANDLGAASQLTAVTKRAARAKAKAPSTYLPTRRSARCAYVKDTVAVKHRWDLSVDRAERTALARALDRYCDSPAVRRPAVPDVASLVGTAPVPMATPASTPTPITTVTPTPTASPVAAPPTTTAPVTTVAPVTTPSPAEPSSPSPAATPTTAPIAAPAATTAPTATPTMDPAPAPVAASTPTPIVTATTPAPEATAPPTTTSSPMYANCTAVRAAGKAPLRVGDPGYSRSLDRDGDGIACE